MPEEMGEAVTQQWKQKKERREGEYTHQASIKELTLGEYVCRSQSASNPVFCR